MAAVSVIKFILTFFFLNVFFILLTPLVETTAYNNSQWNNMPATVLVFRDNIYSFWILFDLIGCGLIAVTAWREAEARATQST